MKFLLLALTIGAGLTFNFMGCEYVPVEPEAEQHGLEIISLAPEMASLNPGTMAAAASVTPEAGGQLVMVFGDVHAATDSIYDPNASYADSTSYGSMPGIKIELNVLPQSVTAAKELTLALDGLNMDMDFGPDGLVFQSPAILNVTATGLDLSNVNEETLDIYYDNTGAGQWERVERDNVIVTKIYRHFADC